MKCNKVKRISASALDIHLQMYNSYREELEVVGSLEPKDQRRLAPETSPLEDRQNKKREEKEKRVVPLPDSVSEELLVLETAQPCKQSSIVSTPLT